MKSQELPAIVALNGMNCLIISCPLLGLSPRDYVLFSHSFYFPKHETLYDVLDLKSLKILYFIIIAGVPDVAQVYIIIHSTLIDTPTVYPRLVLNHNFSPALSIWSSRS